MINCLSILIVLKIVKACQDDVPCIEKCCQIEEVFEEIDENYLHCISR